MVDKFVLISVEIPPISCLIYELALIKVYIAPIYINLDKISSENFKDSITINIIETKLWINNKEKNVRNQLLKNQLEKLTDKVRKAKGESIIKTFSNIYRKE